MKFFSSLALFMLAITGHALGATLDRSAKDGECADGSPNGAQIERGPFIYECRNGEIVPKACITDELKPLAIGSTTDKKVYRLKCLENADKTMTLEPIACLLNGAEHKIDETFEDGANFYNCKRDGKVLRLVNLGCVDNGKRVNLNDEMVKDEFVMLCNGTVNNGARLMPSGCVKDGKQYKVGDSFEVEQFFFTCTRIGRERVALKAAGCVASGKRLNDGDRFVDNEIIKECRIDDGKAHFQTVACAQRDQSGAVVERRLGCTWVEGQAPFQYEVQCQADADSAKKVPIKCNYDVDGGVYNIEPGCFRVIEKSAFGCLKEGSNLKLQSFQGEKAQEAAASSGLRAC